MILNVKGLQEFANHRPSKQLALQIARLVADDIACRRGSVKFPYKPSTTIINLKVF